VRVFSPIVDPFARKRGFAHHALRATRLVVNNEGMGKGSNLVVHRKFGGQPSSVRRPSKAVAWCLDGAQRLRVNVAFCQLASTGRPARRAGVFADRRSFPAKKRIRAPRAACNATCGDQRGDGEGFQPGCSPQVRWSAVFGTTAFQGGRLVLGLHAASPGEWGVLPARFDRPANPSCGCFRRS